LGYWERWLRQRFSDCTQEAFTRRELLALEKPAVRITPQGMEIPAESKQKVTLTVLFSKIAPQRFESNIFIRS